MTYTGFQDVKHTGHPRSVEEVLDLVAHVEAVAGRPLKHKALAVAADCAEKMAGLRTARAELLAQANDQLTAAGLDYAAGNATARDVLLEAVTLASATANLIEIQRLAEVATSGINRHGLDAVSKLGEDWWLAGLKARAAELIDQANTTADEMGHEPRARQEGIVRADHPWAPTGQTLAQDLTVRHAWERLEATLADLDAVYATADELRRLGIVAVVPGREFSEDYRWKHPDRLAGNPALCREFFLANRGHAEPGLFTAAELDGTQAPNVREHGIDRFNAASMAGAV